MWNGRLLVWWTYDAVYAGPWYFLLPRWILSTGPEMLWEVNCCFQLWPHHPGTCVFFPSRTFSSCPTQRKYLISAKQWRKNTPDYVNMKPCDRLQVIVIALSSLIFERCPVRACVRGRPACAPPPQCACTSVRKAAAASLQARRSLPKLWWAVTFTKTNKQLEELKLGRILGEKTKQIFRITRLPPRIQVDQGE